MAEKTIREFNGFFKETLYFFKGLKEHNNKAWFDQNREVYDEFVLEAAKSFVIAMGRKLKSLSPMINADPRTNKSLFRINRDVRFSKDKSPYKTHMGIIFWDGSLPRMESSVYYFHLESDRIMLGTGIYKFTKKQLEEYRNSVVHSRYGKELAKLFKDLTAKGYDFGGKNYKKVPRGFDPGHENAHLLLHDGIHVGKDYKVPKEFYSKDFIDFCFKPFKEMHSLQKWLFELTKRV